MFPLNKVFTIMLNGEIGYADGFAGNGLPFYKNFYGGGVSSVRGYKTSSLGPITTDSNGSQYRIGGNRRLVGNAELLWRHSGHGKEFPYGLVL